MEFIDGIIGISLILFQVILPIVALMWLGYLARSATSQNDEDINY